VVLVHVLEDDPGAFSIASRSTLAVAQDAASPASVLRSSSTSLSCTGVRLPAPMP
jgi:hypothetical protein